VLGAPAFALLHRPRSLPGDRVEVLLGEAFPVAYLAEVPVTGTQTLVVLPYRQLTERGLACRDDGTPLVAMPVRSYATVSVTEALATLPREVPVGYGDFVPDDAAYRDIVRRVLADEIGRGEGSNFVIRRAYRGTVDPTARTALAVFRRLLAQERGAYWTFLVHANGRTLVGASPERHASLRAGTVAMTPISGTYRYPQSGPTVPDLVRFLRDRKETEELYMVVDEELKMLGRICDRGARLRGPRLTEMAHLAHTEYTVLGRTALEPLEVLRETMFAPTVIGSPLPNAARVIARYEPTGRGYYGGVVALVGARGTLDSAILIRTADLRPDGRLEIGVGATLVRRSDPDAEVAETRAKAGGLLAAIGADRTAPAHPPLARHPHVAHALESRNERLSRFWLAPVAGGRLALADQADPARVRPLPDLAGRRVLVVDGGDAFTRMLGIQIRAVGPHVTIHGWETGAGGSGDDLSGYDAVVVGPGPGDPCALADPKIAALRTLTATLLAERIPVLSVCLGHQVLAGLLGLPLRRRPVPAQGEQREIDLFGRVERVGFYHTFAAYSEVDRVVDVEVCRDPVTREVYALRGPGVRSVQFHPESVLTQRGADIVRGLVTALLRVPDRADLPTWLAPTADRPDVQRESSMGSGFRTMW
jgi:2-amino-4-deoxychorismate synthase